MKKYLISILAIIIFMSPIQIIAAADLQPPQSSIELTGNQGSNGIYYGQATMTINAADNDSGISVIQYRINNGAWLTYSNPVVFTESRAYRIHYRSIDTSNNIEEYKTLNFSLKPDAIPPSTTIQVDGQMGETSYYVGPVNLEFTAVDYQSGVDFIEYSMDEGATWTKYLSVVTINDPDSNLVYYRSQDKNGNIEKTKKVAQTRNQCLTK